MKILKGFILLQREKKSRFFIQRLLSSRVNVYVSYPIARAARVKYHRRLGVLTALEVRNLASRHRLD